MKAKNYPRKLYQRRHYFKSKGLVDSMPPLPPANVEKADRNRAALERWLDGESLAKIGDSIGLTRERVRQIVSKSIANLGDSEDPGIADRIIARKTGNRSFKKPQHANRMALRRQLKELFETRFDRDKIIEILGMEQDPDILTMPEKELCEVLHDQFRINRFFKYTRCSACETVKPNDQFPPAVVTGNLTCHCTKCNTDRHRQMMLENPDLQKRAYEIAMSKPNRFRIYQLRHYYLRQGLIDKMPPLPPKEVPDSEVVAPPKQIPGLRLKEWRESVGRVFNRKKAAEKVKKLVRDDAASRHISI